MSRLTTYSHGPLTQTDNTQTAAYLLLPSKINRQHPPNVDTHRARLSVGPEIIGFLLQNSATIVYISYHIAHKAAELEHRNVNMSRYPQIRADWVLYKYV